MGHSELIRQEMEKAGAIPSKIPLLSSKQGVRGFSQLNCSNPECSRRWSTHQAHVVIDLKGQTVLRIWKQKCKSCDNEQEPTFADGEFIRLVGKAIEQEKKFRSRKNGASFKRKYEDDDDRDGPPHESSLCEKCGYGASPCWLKKKGSGRGRRGYKGRRFY